MGIHRRTLARKTTVIAVTGASGKSTSVRYIAAALGLGGGRQMAFSTLHVSGSRSRFVRRSFRARELVIEVGIQRPGEMRPLVAGMRPDIAVVTAVGSGGEHAIAYRDAAHVAQEKGDLVRALAPGGVAILNGDDPLARQMAAIPGGPRILFGFGEDNDVQATDFRLDWPNGSAFRVSARGQSAEVRTCLVGRVSAYPVLAAAAVALVRGRSLEQVAARVAGLEAIPGRLEIVRLPGDVVAIHDDYKGSLDSMHAALDVLEAAPAARKVLLLGDLDGPPDPARPHYRAIGRRVAAIADHVLLAETNWKAYRAGLNEGGMTKDQYTRVQGIVAAAEALRAQLTPGSVVLVKGRQRARLYRAMLMLSGRDVSCTIERCPFTVQICERCRYLERGWHSPPPLTLRG